MRINKNVTIELNWPEIKAALVDYTRALYKVSCSEGLDVVEASIADVRLDSTGPINDWSASIKFTQPDKHVSPRKQS